MQKCSAILFLGLLAFCSFSTSCDSGCPDELVPIHNGEYLVVEISYPDQPSDTSYIENATVTVEEERVLVLYEKEGSEYLIEYVLK